MSLIRLFSGAGAAGHVFLLRNGKRKNMGLAYSGLIGPTTTPAVVPTTPLILDFSIDARTKDKQQITVAGNLKVTLDPAVAVAHFDFTVTAKGSYVSPWQDVLRALVTEKVLAPVRGAALTLDIEIAAKSHTSFETAVMAEVSGTSQVLSGLGITVTSCSVSKVIITNQGVGDAIGSKERELMLGESDTARHDRRMLGAKNDREVRTYEAETALKQEEDRTKLIEMQGSNEKLEATTKAAAAKEGLTAFEGIDAAKLLSIALVKFAEEGNVGTLNIGHELLTALRQQ